MTAARNSLWIASALVALVALALPLRADAPVPRGSAEHRKKGDPLPEELGDEIGIDPPPGARVDLDLPFVDQDGREIRLRDCFPGDRPVLLNLVYYRCPSMCGVVLEAQLESLRQLEWSPGNEFRVVTVSINPQETPNLAREKRAVFLRQLGRPSAEEGWDWLTGDRAAIAALCESLGFKFRFDTRTREYAHAAGIYVLTPEGKLSRTLYGTDYEPRTLRLSLVEAGEGKVGGFVDRILLFCYHFDPGTGRYTAQVMTIMRAGGLLTVVLLCAFLAAQQRRARLRAAASLDSSPKEGA